MNLTTRFATVSVATAVTATLLFPSLGAAVPAISLVCGDANGNGSVTSSDALSVLRRAVGQPATVLCCAAEMACGRRMSTARATT